MRSHKIKFVSNNCNSVIRDYANALQKLTWQENQIEYDSELSEIDKKHKKMTIKMEIKGLKSKHSIDLNINQSKIYHGK